MPIRILATEVANQIAAGEVVERPASVVKELVENSLDAGATDIRVEVREGGRRLVRVQDDGCGIPAAEVELAFARHATSKIASADDLSHLTTLGFRGEALASIASVAQVTLLTRARDEEIGSLLRLAEGREISREPHGAPAGTVITVEHVFANVPARLKFLKQAATEAGHIQQIVTRFALAYPERRFNLVSDGKLLFQSTGSGKLVDVLVKVYGLEMARGMIEIGERERGREGEDGGENHLDETLTHSPIPHSPVHPFSHRRHRLHRRAGDAPQPPRLHHALRQPALVPGHLHRLRRDPGLPHAAADGTLPGRGHLRGDRPRRGGCQRAPDQGRGAVPREQRGLRRGATCRPPSADRSSAGAAGEPGARAKQRPSRLPPSATELGSDGRLVGAPRRAARCGRQGSGGRNQESGVGIRGAHQLPASSFQLPTPPLPSLPLLRVVGQLGATYVVCEGPDGMYLIDQHAAHERILYEQFLAERAAQKLAIQPLLEPLVLDLNPEQAAVVADELATLGEMGIAIEPFGGSSYLVRSIPAILSKDNPQSALVEIIDGLAQGDDVVGSSHEAALVTLICKRAAVKGGHVMSTAEMQELVRRLEACRSPRTCPHGRPTMIHLSATELARQFGRM